MTLVVVLTDANVLFSRVLRDYFMYAAEQGIVELRWSTRILDEMTRNHTLKRGISEDQGRNLVDLLNRAIPMALVDPTQADFDVFGSVAMPDPDDRHVLAAAVAAEADVLCTMNVKDFPPEAMLAVGVKLMTPDAVLQQLIMEFPEEMKAAHQRTVESSKGGTTRRALEALEKALAPNASQAMAVAIKRHYTGPYLRSTGYVSGYWSPKF